MQAALCIIIFLILQKKVVYLTPHKSKTSSKTLKVKKKNILSLVFGVLLFLVLDREQHSTPFSFFTVNVTIWFKRHIQVEKKMLKKLRKFQIKEEWNRNCMKMQIKVIGLRGEEGTKEMTARSRKTKDRVKSS